MIAGVMTGMSFNSYMLSKKTDQITLVHLQDYDYSELKLGPKKAKFTQPGDIVRKKSHNTDYDYVLGRYPGNMI